MIKVVIKDVPEVVEGVNEASRLGIGRVDKLSGKYVVDVIEAAFIIQTGRGEVVDSSGKKLSVGELFTMYSKNINDWAKFAVYYDLRMRGRRVRMGFQENDLIVEYGSEKIAVFVTEENNPIAVSKLLEWVKYALSKDLRPILAVVDMHGDITYYEVLETNLVNIG